MISHGRGIRVLLCLLSMTACVSWGLDPSHRLTQMAHRAWLTREGNFTGRPSTFAQTPDGYLWVTSSAGLLRFNGVKFSQWKDLDGAVLQGGLASMVAADDGSLWIGTGSDLIHVHNGRATHLDVESPVMRVVREDNGKVWMSRMQARPSGPVCEVQEPAVLCHANFPFATAAQLIVDQQHAVWSGTATVCRWNGSTCVDSFPANLSGFERNDRATGLAVASDGSVWAAHDRGKVTIFGHFVGGRWEMNPIPTLHLPAEGVTTLYGDAHGCLWIGTRGTGLYRWCGRTLEHLDSHDGLSGNWVTSFFTDREGTLWIGTDGGVDTLRDLSIVTWSMREGLSQEGALSFLPDEHGGALIGHPHSLDRLEDGRIRPIAIPAALGSDDPDVLLRDHAGRLWMAGFGKLLVQEGKGFREIVLPRGWEHGIYDLEEDAEHTIWVRTSQGLHFVRDGRLIEAFPEANFPLVARILPFGERGVVAGLRTGQVARVWADHFEMWTDPAVGPSLTGMTSYGEVVWTIGANSLIVWRNGEPVTIAFRERPEGRMEGVYADPQGNVWFWTDLNLMRIGKEEVPDWSKPIRRQVRYETWTASDGAQMAYSAYGPSYVVDRRGVFWVLGATSLQEVDPARFVRNTVIPPVKIERVLADHREYGLVGPLRFPAGTRDLQIDYTALSFASPDKVRFRYRLEGAETEWQEAVDRRQAFYNNLKPGSYTFRVIACNNSGLWNMEGASMAMTIPPTLLEAAWFRGFLAVCAGLLAWGAVWWRIQAVRAEARMTLNARMLERERIARTLHDTLLQGVQGMILQFHAIARSLPADHPAREPMAQAIGLAKDVVVEGRDQVRELRRKGSSVTPLATQIQQLAPEVKKMAGVDFRVFVDGAAAGIVAIVQDEIYMICREAILNSAQHARATEIACSIRYETKWLTVLCRDNGKGLEEPVALAGGRDGHWGLLGMKERAKRLGAGLAWRKALDGGTEVELRVPGRVAYPADERHGWRAILRFKRSDHGR